MSRLSRLTRAARGQHGEAAPGRPKPGGPVPPLVNGPGIAEAWDLQTLTPGVPARPGGVGGAAPGDGDVSPEGAPPSAMADTPEPSARPQPEAGPDGTVIPPADPAPTERASGPEAMTPSTAWQVDLPASGETRLPVAGLLAPVSAAARHLSPMRSAARERTPARDTARQVAPPPTPQTASQDERPSTRAPPERASRDMAGDLPADVAKRDASGPETPRDAPPIAPPPARRDVAAALPAPGVYADTEGARETLPSRQGAYLTIGSLDVRIVAPPEPPPPKPRAPRHGAGLSASSVLRRSRLRRL